MKKLKDLIKTDLNLNVYGIADDSRNIKEGYLFVATKGYNVDHYDYIKNAIDNGCCCVISDRNVNYDIPYIKVDNVNDIYYKICEKFYDIDLDYFSFIGITGTDGKTTTTTIIKNLINNIRHATLIGTNGAKVDDIDVKVNNTTPIITELYNVLSIAKENNSKDVIMEVSSEALLHDRVKNFKYNIVGFTNITEDHLNVHKTLDNYINTKKKLLNYLKNDGVVIVNGDDNNCKDIVSNNVIRFGKDLSNDCIIVPIEKNNIKTIFEIHYLGNTYKIIMPFVGEYNMYNVTMAFLVCLHCGLAPEYLVDAISKLSVVSGRRESINFGQDFEIILDYAHTLNGIKNVIQSVNKNRKKIVVTGCAGGREKSKRSLIGSYILDNVDIAIFTMDDPRYEDPNDIIDDMVKDSSKDYIRVIDRALAIEKAFDLADKDTTVLILGKGRDNYMAIEDKKLEYCDYEVIKNYFDR